MPDRYLEPQGWDEFDIGVRRCLGLTEMLVTSFSPVFYAKLNGHGGACKIVGMVDCNERWRSGLAELDYFCRRQLALYKCVESKKMFVPCLFTKSDQKGSENANLSLMRAVGGRW